MDPIEVAADSAKSLANLSASTLWVWGLGGFRVVMLISSSIYTVYTVNLRHHINIMVTLQVFYGCRHLGRARNLIILLSTHPTTQGD
jgi:hypothetical protein